MGGVSQLPPDERISLAPLGASPYRVNSRAQSVVSTGEIFRTCHRNHKRGIARSDRSTQLSALDRSFGISAGVDSRTDESYSGRPDLYVDRANCPLARFGDIALKLRMY